jgi:hypothetical protein
MRTPQTTSGAPIRRVTGALALALLLVTTGCVYNGHRNMGATEKWQASGVHTIPKAIGFPFVAIGDSIISPATALCDYWSYDEQYHPDHEYLTYAGSRTIGRSDMGDGWQVVASVPSILFETLFLIVTGPIDLVTVLASDDDDDYVD